LALSKKAKQRSRRGKRRRERSFFEALFAAVSTKPAKKKPSRKAKVSSEFTRGKKLAKQRRLKGVAKPVGYEHYEYVCNCGPYVTGFYNVKEVDKKNGVKGTGTIGVFRRSAAQMRKFSMHRESVCP
jgi:hypothetical protein